MEEGGGGRGGRSVWEGGEENGVRFCVSPVVFASRPENRGGRRGVVSCIPFPVLILNAEGNAYRNDMTRVTLMAWLLHLMSPFSLKWPKCVSKVTPGASLLFLLPRFAFMYFFHYLFYYLLYFILFYQFILFMYFVFILLIYSFFYIYIYKEQQITSLLTSVSFFVFFYHCVHYYSFTYKGPKFLRKFLAS